RARGRAGVLAFAPKRETSFSIRDALGRAGVLAATALNRETSVATGDAPGSAGGPPASRWTASRRPQTGTERRQDPPPRRPTCWRSEVLGSFRRPREHVPKVADRTPWAHGPLREPRSSEASRALARRASEAILRSRSSSEPNDASA